MASLYHIIDKIPKLERYGTELEYEDLAEKLVASGLLRIDTEDKCNFIRFTYPEKSINKAFSYKELFDIGLQARLNQYFKKVYDNIDEQALTKKIQLEVNKLKKEFSKVQLPDENLTLKIARLFVLSAHPIVIAWLLLEEVEVFIAYSNIIGDVMDIGTWKIAGQNSGMQSTNGVNAHIFVSCGGDPFRETSIEHPTYGDGWPAIARLQIIAAQELGHYSDIIRDNTLRHIDRHSADIMGRKAKNSVIIARHSDIKTTQAFLTSLEPYGIRELIKNEEALKFFRKNKVYNLKYLFHLLKTHYYKYKILKNVQKLDIYFIKKFSKDTYFGLMLRALSEDMLLNIAPQAEVYKRSDKNDEEAIACIEALARVPQQVIKWGYLPTKFFMKDLYHIYYTDVIPSLINSYEVVTGIRYQRNYKIIKPSLKIQILNFLKSITVFKQKDSLPSREV